MAVRYEYDQEGRLKKTIDGNGNEILMEYATGSLDACTPCSSGKINQPMRIIFPTFEKTFTYDKLGRKTSETDVINPDEAYYSELSYDEAGNLVEKIDREGNKTRYDYDSLKRLVLVADPLGGETEYAYDGRNNLISLKDAEGNVTRFEYDLNNRMVKEIKPMGEETTYAYNALGKLVEKIDAGDQKITYAYNASGRLSHVRHFATSASETPEKTVSFTHDNVGNVTGYDDGVTSAQYQYDNLNRKVSESVNYGAFELQNDYAYYNNGLKRTFTGPDNITYGYAYNDNNQLESVEIPNSGFVSVNEYNWFAPAVLSFPGGTRLELTYDPLMRIESMLAKDPGENELLNRQYNYDRMNNITEKQTESGSFFHVYDDLYRLESTIHPEGADEAFTYDKVGNRQTSDHTVDPWEYNENNELTGYDDFSYQYDANGNMVQKTVGVITTRFFYNTENRLVRVENGSGSILAQYYYDPFGRRLWKEVGGVRTYYHYADEGLVGEYDASGNVIRTYGYVPGSGWSTNPLFMKAGEEYYFYHNDHMGTPQKLKTVNGEVVWSATYSSFGKASIAVEGVENNFRFPGQYFDAETGLHYNYHRYYDPNTGRYLRADPIGLAGGINLFAYVLNNPVNFSDPLGLWSMWLGGSTIASFGVWGGNKGGGVAFDSNDGGLGLYGTNGSSSGFAGSAGAEFGFFTGSVSGETDTFTIGIIVGSIGIVTDDSGNYGFILGGAVGAPAEGTISHNVTDFVSFVDIASFIWDKIKPDSDSCQ